tara:strand:- start:14969 stop:15748 length:780 start_codon:yes stop_codon:yes gene_type:complete
MRKLPLLVFLLFTVGHSAKAESFASHMLDSYNQSGEMSKISEKLCTEKDMEDPKVLFNLAEVYWGSQQNRDESKAYDYYLKAADKGHPDAHARIATLYAKGSSAVEKDPKKADAYFKKACDLGYKWACCYVSDAKKCGENYFSSKGDWADFLFLNNRYDEAYDFIMKNRDSSDPKLLFYRGMFHEKGIKVKRDTDKAIYYYEKATAAGLGKAAYRLGILNLKKDEIKSQYYFEKACDLGYKLGCRARYAGVFLDHYAGI